MLEHYQLAHERFKLRAVEDVIRTYLLANDWNSRADSIDALLQFQRHRLEQAEKKFPPQPPPVTQ